MTDRINRTQLAKRLGKSKPAITQFVKSGRLKFDSDNLIEYADAVKQLSESESKLNTVKNGSVQSTDDKNLTHYKTETEKWKSLTAELEYYKEKSILVSTEQVQHEAQRIGRLLKDSLFAISERTSAIIANESDQLKVRKILNDEIRNTLAEIINQLSQNKEVADGK